MIGINEMPLVDIREIESIIKMTHIKSNQVHRMTNFTQKYIDKSCHICGHCGSQIRFAHTRLVKWYERSATAISVRKQELLNPVEKHTCKVCDTEIKDKRKKYCSNECKNKK